MFMYLLQPYREKQNQSEDAGIQAEAWMALWKADDLRSLDINSLDLIVHDGDMWLIGHVVNAYHRQLAESLVKAVRGVNRLYNELVADSDLVIEVAQALAADGRTRSYVFPVGAFHGWIHLGGQSPTQGVRSAAEEVAARVPTVRGVVTLPHLPNDNGSTCVESGKGNCQIQPQIGDQVYARDGLAGKVVGVIINPRNRLVAHVVVAADFESKGQTMRGEFRVPAEAVNHANEGSLFLSDSLRDLVLHPVFDEADFPPAPPEWRPPYPYTRGTVRWLIERSEEKWMKN